MNNLLLISLIASHFSCFALPPDDPTNITISDSEICTSSVSILTASCSGSFVRWWDSATARTPLRSGSSYPFIPTTPGTMVIYVSCNTALDESNRIALAPINVYETATSPTINYPSSAIAVCPSTFTTLSASCDNEAKPIWHENQFSTIALDTGEVFTKKISQASSYWVECGNPGCVSGRVGTPTINISSVSSNAQTTLNTDVICSTTTFNLQANTPFTNNEGDYFWTKNDELFVENQTTLSAINGLPSGGFNDFLMDGTDIYIATNNGIRKTTNNGTSFSTISTANGLPNNQVISLAKFQNFILAGTSTGPAFSSDNGLTFTGFGAVTGVQNLVVKNIVIDPSKGILFCTDSGLYVSRNNGLSFTQYTTSNGLTSNIIKDVVFIPAKNEYWVLTSADLAISKDGFDTFLNYGSLYGMNTVDLRDIVINDFGTEMYVLSASGALSHSVSISSASPIFSTIYDSPSFQSPSSLAILNSGLMALGSTNGTFMYKQNTRIANPLSNTLNAEKVFLSPGYIWVLGTADIKRVAYNNTKTQNLTGLVVPDQISHFVGTPNGSCPASAVVNASDTVKVGGTPQDPVNFSADFTLCAGSGYQTSASCPNSTVSMQWFDDANSITSIHTGNFYNVPSINSNITFYAECVAPTGCKSQRIEGATVTVEEAPIPTSVTANKTEVCEEESVLFTGSCGFNTLNRWFDSQSGGTSIQSGGFLNSPVTPTQSQFYLGCVSSSLGCASATRIATPAITFKANADALYITYNSIINGNTTTLAGDYLQANNMLNAPSSVVFKAGKSLQFSPGFESKSGTVFSATIEAPCVNSSTPSNATF